MLVRSSSLDVLLGIDQRRVELSAETSANFARLEILEAELLVGAPEPKLLDMPAADACARNQSPSRVPVSVYNVASHDSLPLQETAILDSPKT